MCYFKEGIFIYDLWMVGWLGESDIFLCEIDDIELNMCMYYVC